jgi:hypothetical protein
MRAETPITTTPAGTSRTTTAPAPIVSLGIVHALWRREGALHGLVPARPVRHRRVCTAALQRPAVAVY